MTPPHGVMFHHFHGGEHPAGQGSMSAADLEAMISFLGPKNILPAREWMDRALAGRLRPGELCLTFDDGLRCQWDVAYPVMKALGLDAFWFVYTSPLEGRVERLELYRYFRTVRYPGVADFYRAFDAAAAQGPHAGAVSAALAGFDPKSYLKDFPFYTDADRRFRFVRDQALGPARYDEVMDRMMTAAGFSTDGLAAKLWIDDAIVARLHAEGHVIGLHSHTHPTQLCALPPGEQEREYRLNSAHLAKVTGRAPNAMSHPCNSYDEGTLAFLKGFGLEFGFRANMAMAGAHGPLEHPREDHANILKAMRRS